MCIFFQILPREQFSNSHRLSLSAARGRRIIVYLALADVMAAFGMKSEIYSELVNMCTNF